MKTARFAVLLAAALMVLAFVGFYADTEPLIVAHAQDLSLVSMPVTEAPTLDGVADEAFWEEATVLEISTRRGANEGATDMTLRSVYTEDTVYFVVQWEDPTQSFLRSPWQLQEDGTWLKLSDPDDRGGDNNVWYEDKLAIIWNINIAEFEFDGCFVACHTSSSGDPKPYGNKYTENEGELGDIWHWKSVRNLNQMDDQYLDSVRYSPETVEAGRHSDPKDAGGYRDNVTEDKSGPAFMSASADFAKDGSPGFLLEDDIVEIDASMFEPGDLVPGIIISEITGDRGNISAGWVYADGMWTLEIGRALVTGSEFDVQFEDLTATYYFGIANFDNAQVRHAYEGDPISFMFAQP